MFLVTAYIRMSALSLYYIYERYTYPFSTAIADLRVVAVRLYLSVSTSFMRCWVLSDDALLYIWLDLLVCLETNSYVQVR